MSSVAEIKSAIIDLDAKIQAEQDPKKKQAMTDDLARLFELHDAAMGASTPPPQMPIAGRAGAMMRRGTPDVVGAVQGIGQAISGSPAGQTFSEEMDRFGPEVRRRSAQIIGQELDLTDPGKVAGVAVSQAARAGGATLSSFIGTVIPNNIKEGAANLYNNLKETC